MPITHIAGANVEGLPLSEAVHAGDFLFISGMVGFNADGTVVKGGVTAETSQIMKDLVDVLNRSGAQMSQLVKVNVYLTRAEDFDAFNAVYRDHFPDAKPARICVVAGMTIDAKIEMDFVAYVGD